MQEDHPRIIAQVELTDDSLCFIKSAIKPQAFELGDEWLPGAKRRPFMGFYLKPQPLGWGVVHL